LLTNILYAFLNSSMHRSTTCPSLLTLIIFESTRYEDFCFAVFLHSHYIRYFRSKHSSQHSLLRCSQFMFFPKGEKLGLTPI
jgi:hypothetical protein